MKYYFEQISSSDVSLQGVILAKRLIKDFLGTEADIVYDKNGKPRIKDSHCGISISHSFDMVFCGIAGGEIGVDTEKIRDFDERISSRFFTLSEKEFARKSKENFFKVWTVKEAIVKFTGEGLKALTRVCAVENGNIISSWRDCKVKSFIENGYAFAVVWEEKE
ncbi:MAG: 4'-phosphopantetheinyl transferase superfamily protein [Clostridia bacterium]|nr:4'-phosphopantetheinyl transferase superfamily protein [Clostridia bacterium]